MKTILRAGLMSGAALVVMSGTAFAADLGMKDKAAAAEPERELKITVNGGLTTDYVFRGVSQNDNDPSVFAGTDLSYGIFYAGFWAAAVDEATSRGNLEVDLYAGIKPKWRDIEFDFGVIYYGYPNGENTGINPITGVQDLDPAYFELKAGASTKLVRDITVSGTVFWSPDYYFETGSTWTLEGKASAPLPFWGLTLSGTLGYITSEDDNEAFSAAFGDDNYTYWNVGLSKTFRDHYTFDVRYWNTNVDDNAPAEFLAGDRIVGTFTFNY